MEQPKVGPQGEGEGSTESKDTESTEGFLGMVITQRAFHFVALLA